MGIQYYKIPLQFSKVVEGDLLPVCSLIDSISKNLELIIMTKYGEHRSDPTFGCGIWDLDFELIVSQETWSGNLRQSLEVSIKKHEPRISNITISVSISDIKKPYFAKQFPK